MVARPAAAALLVLGSLFASALVADPAAVIYWQFSYTGPRVAARGVVETEANPEPDGSYRILSVTGKRNGKRIVELLPEGEVLTSAEQFMFADNRLLPVSPFVSEGGFSYRTSDSKYFNLCHAGENGNCGAQGYGEFDGKKGFRAVRFELTRIPDTTTPADMPVAPDGRSAGDSG
jgi:hypothetical protein